MEFTYVCGCVCVCVRVRAFSLTRLSNFMRVWIA